MLSLSLFILSRQQPDFRNQISEGGPQLTVTDGIGNIPVPGINRQCLERIAA